MQLIGYSFMYRQKENSGTRMFIWSFLKPPFANLPPSVKLSKAVFKMRTHNGLKGVRLMRDAVKQEADA